LVAFNYDEYDNEIKGIISEWQFHNLAWSLNKIITPVIALLCGKYLSNQLDTIIPQPNQPNAIKFINQLREYWRTRNVENAKDLFELLKMHDEWNFLWDLAENPNNKLVIDIILLALNNTDAKGLFQVTEGLKIISICFELLKNEKNVSIDSLIVALLENSDLEKEIINDSELNVKISSKELFYVVKSSRNSQLINLLVEKIKVFSKEEWYDSLENDTYLTSLAIAIKEKDKDFSLNNCYFDALIDFTKNYALEKVKLSDWQRDSWSNLFSLMSSAFQKEYKKDLSKFLMDKYQEITKEFVQLNHKYFDYNKLKQEQEFIQNMTREAIKSKDLPLLKWLNESVIGSKFKPQDHFPEVIKESLNILFKDEGNNLNNKSLIMELAEKFKVDIIEEQLGNKLNAIQKILINNKWRLYYNPKNNPDTYKIMRFANSGKIIEGYNKNESSWRAVNNLLELIDSDGKVHSRFNYDPKNHSFNHTNDPDTGSIIKHSIRDQYMILEK
jgi:hypothetical protein